MGKETNIQWTDHTFNIVWGCTKVSEGCENCYAEKWARRTGIGWGPAAERRVFGEKHWREPLAWNRAAEQSQTRRRVFCSSMADVFEDRLTLSLERLRLWTLIEATPWLDWLLLTKRPENVDAMMPPNWRGKWPQNVWLGFTGENQKRFDERWQEVENLAYHHNIAVVFCSAEPLLGPLDVSSATQSFGGDDERDSRILDWIIVGGESGSGARPFDLNWAGKIIADCDDSTRVFVKQFGSKPVLLGREIKLKDTKGGDWDEWPCPYRVREIPAFAV